MGSKQNRNRGKEHERKIAKRLGGLRVGLLCGEDVSHNLYSIECKSRVKIVTTNWMEQAENNCPEGKTPILVTHIKGQSYDKDLVSMRMTDWEKLHEQIQRLNRLLLNG